MSASPGGYLIQIRYYRGPFTNNNAIRLLHNHALDLATKGKHMIRLPDRTLIWSEEYEQRLQEYESRTVSGDKSKP